MNAEKKLFDVVIIGAGPIGMACGIEADKAGLKYLIIDKGCLVNSIYHYPLNMTFFSTSDRLEIGDVPFISHGSKPNRFEALEYYRRVASNWNLQLKLYECVLRFERKTHFHVITDRSSYESRCIVFATGFYDLPYLMNIPGENLPKVRHYYDEPHPYFDQDIIVVGAGNSAVDVALETWRKGAKVTMIIREDSLGDNIKYWVKPDIENRIKEGQIKAYFNSEITAIRERDVDIKTPDKEFSMTNDFVLAMTGYQPDYSLLEDVGIEIMEDEFQTPQHNQETQETNVPGVFLAGVICGGLLTNKWFIENSREHAPKIINQVKKKLDNYVSSS